MTEKLVLGVSYPGTKEKTIMIKDIDTDKELPVNKQNMGNCVFLSSNVAILNIPYWKLIFTFKSSKSDKSTPGAHVFGTLISDRIANLCLISTAMRYDKALSLYSAIIKKASSLQRVHYSIHYFGVLHDRYDKKFNNVNNLNELKLDYTISEEDNEEFKKISESLFHDIMNTKLI